METIGDETMKVARMSANKSHLLAYLKHTPGFAQHIRTFENLPISEILDQVREQDEQAHDTCVNRFAQYGVDMTTAT